MEHRILVDPTAAVAGNATLRGDVTVGAEASIWYGAGARGDMAPITVGRGTNIQEGCILHVDEGYPLTVGEYCTVGHRALLHGCTIGDRTLIGMGAIVMDGAHVGCECLIGAGALVTEGTVIPDGSMAFGSPARVIRALTEEERARLGDAARHYIAIRDELKA